MTISRLAADLAWEIITRLLQFLSCEDLRSLKRESHYRLLERASAGEICTCGACEFERGMAPIPDQRPKRGQGRLTVTVFHLTLKQPGQG